MNYCKSCKHLDTSIIAVIILKSKKVVLTNNGSKDVEGMARSVDPDQTTPTGAV